MSAPSLAELLPPLERRPWVTPQRRIRDAMAAREQLRRWGYELSVSLSGRQLHIAMPRQGMPVPPDVEKLVRRHWNPLLALLTRPNECEALLENRWRRFPASGMMARRGAARIRFPRHPRRADPDAPET